MSNENTTTTGIAALSKFLKEDPNPPTASEIMEFKKSCTPEQWAGYCKEAQNIMDSRGHS